MSSGFLPRLLAAGSRSSAPSLRQPCRPSSSRLLPALLVRRLSSSPRALDKAPEGSSLPASREGTAPARGSELLPQQPSHLSRLEDRSAPAFPPPALSTERNKLEAKRTKPLRKPRQKPEQPLSSSFATPGLEAAPNFALSHLPVASPSLAQSGQPAASEEERPQPPEAVAVSSPRTRVQLDGLPDYISTADTLFHIFQLLKDNLDAAGKIYIRARHKADSQAGRDRRATVDFMFDRRHNLWPARSVKEAERMAKKAVYELDGLDFLGSTLRVKIVKKDAPAVKPEPAGRPVEATTPAPASKPLFPNPSPASPPLALDASTAPAPTAASTPQVAVAADPPAPDRTALSLASPASPTSAPEATSTPAGAPSSTPPASGALEPLSLSLPTSSPATPTPDAPKLPASSSEGPTSAGTATRVHELSKTRILLSPLRQLVEKYTRKAERDAWEDKLSALLLDKVGARGELLVSPGRRNRTIADHDGYAFVDFATSGVDAGRAEEVARKAIAALNGFDVLGAPLSVQYAEPAKASPDKPSSAQAPDSALQEKRAPSGKSSPPSSSKAVRPPGFSSSRNPPARHSSSSSSSSSRNGWKAGGREALDDGPSDRSLFDRPRSSWDQLPPPARPAPRAGLAVPRRDARERSEWGARNSRPWDEPALSKWGRPSGGGSRDLSDRSR